MVNYIAKLTKNIEITWILLVLLNIGIKNFICTENKKHKKMTKLNKYFIFVREIKEH